MVSAKAGAGFVQIHLSTAIILMIVAGGLLAFNLNIFTWTLTAQAAHAPAGTYDPNTLGGVTILMQCFRAAGIVGSLLTLWLVRTICEWWFRTD